MGLEARKERTKKLFNKEHWNIFADFTRYEMASGGPDPHVAFTGALARDCSLEEKLWRGGCYISAYNVATAEVIWRDWKYPPLPGESMLPWFYEHWDGMTTRTERKGVRIKENMATYFDTYAAWVRDVLDGKKVYLTDKSFSPTERYEAAWVDTMSSIKFFGRYVAIKFLEYCKRYCGFDIELPDVRPIDGWSPRTTLSLLFPKRIDYFLGNDSPENMKVINESSQEALHILREDYGLKQADMFTLECVLCNYRQSYVGLKLYPGRTHDTERKYMAKIERHWEKYPDRPPLEFYNVRKQVFPTQHLAELNDNWTGKFSDGVRSKDIGVLTKQGFIWSDLLYDYNATVEQGRSFSDPVVRHDNEAIENKAWKLRKRALRC